MEISLTSAGRRHHPKLWEYCIFLSIYKCVCVCCGGYGSVSASLLILTVVDICISGPPDRAALSITADPTVQLRAYKQPGNDGVLQLLQQHQLISIHIPLPNPLMPIFVSHTLAISQISSCSFPHEQPDRCSNLWWGLWPLFSLCVLLLLLFGRREENFYFATEWSVSLFTCDVGNSKTRSGNYFQW